MTKDLFGLPQELRIQILSSLDAVSLVNCAMTCKLMHETLQNSSKLLYIIQLHFNGLKYAGTSIPHSKLIWRLLRHREAWKSLMLGEELDYVALDMKHRCQAYEFVAGAFANTNKQHLEIVWLPTFNDSETRTLRRDLTEMPIRDITMDPTQDLIVFLEDDVAPSSTTATRTIRVHIRTISTNTTHPLAYQSPLCFTVHPDPVHGNTIHRNLLQLVRNTLMFFFCTLSQDQPQVHIWDWTTSHVLADSSMSFDPLLPPLIYDFGLLDSTYCFVASADGSGSIRLYELIQSPSATNTPIHLVTLHLPPTSNETNICIISAHAGPIEANPLPHTPFTINNEDRLHVFTVVYSRVNAGGMNPSFNMFVHQRVFTKYCVRGAVPLDIPWAEWGPRNTHIISPYITQRQWVRWVHGQRVISEPDQGEIHILDFSRSAVSSAKDADMVHDTSRTLVLSSTIRTSQLPFQEDVKTSLPYVSSKMDCENVYWAHMIYADGVVGVTAGGNILLHVYPILQERTSLETLNN